MLDFFLFSFSDPETQSFFELHYAEFFDRLYSYAAIKLRDGMEAEDCVQDAMIKFAGIYDAGRFPNDAAAFAYLFIVLKTTITERIRDKAKESHAELDELRIPDPSAEDIDARLDLEQAISELPEEYGNAVILKYQFGMTLAEIAKSLGVSVSTVSERLKKARAVLKERCGR